MNQASALWNDIETYAAKLNAPQDLRSKLVTLAREAKTSIETASAALTAIKQDPTLSAEGKKLKAQPVRDATTEYVRHRVDELTSLLKTAREEKEAATAWPSASSGGDAQAVLLTARADLNQLMQNTKPTERAERLAFAVRNGDDAMRHLILGERFPERILLPSLPDSQVDATLWAEMRNGLYSEYHPGGDTARADLAILDSLNTTGKQVEQIAAAAMRFDLLEIVGE